MVPSKSILNYFNLISTEMHFKQWQAIDNSSTEFEISSSSEISS